MGEAKRRGSKEERMNQALDDFSPISISQIKAEMNIPQDAVSLGYVIHLPESDEFLGDYQDGNIILRTAWTPTPSLAKRISDFHKAVAIVKELERPDRDTILCLLFEDKNRFYVAYSS